MKKKVFAILGSILTVGAVLAGCGNTNAAPPPVEDTTESGNSFVLSEVNDSEKESNDEMTQTKEELTVRFGDEGEPFTMHLYDNDTASAIARHVGTSDWRLPIYHYDDYDDWEVMQYYDIPSRYEIPSAPEAVTEEKAGTVYYSEPNRIVLFYQDAEVSAEYTPVGYFDYTEEFVQAVQDNPVLEGWGNKIVQISDGE